MKYTTNSSQMVDNTDLPSNSNIDELSNDTQVDRLCTCGSLVIDVYEKMLMLMFMKKLEYQKLRFSVFLRPKGRNKIK